jgi:mannose-1-phosphate guanylyltransferase / phosphomannomutase
MKAVIMAGGEGTRLRPLTSNQPKPMLPMANRPMMEHVVNLLRQHGFEDIVVTVAFMANAIRSYFMPPRRRRSARPARCATPATSSTSASS